jgi:hypothetical protein
MSDITRHLTEDERLDLKRIVDGIKWREYERDVLAPRRAAEEAARQAEATATEHRLREYARAEHAALVWTSWDTLPAEVLRLQRHYVDLALEEPRVDLFWLSRDTRSAELVGKNNALSFGRFLKVVAPPITGRATAVDVGHEIGHCRTAHVQGRLQREAAAWRWSKEHCLFWDKTTQASMVRALQTYTNGAEKVDVLDVMAIEELCSTDEFRREQNRQLQRNLAAEQAQLQAQLQDRKCVRCERRPATELFLSAPTCSGCAAKARDEMHQRVVDEEFARLRREGDLMRRPPLRSV